MFLKMWILGFLPQFCFYCSVLYQFKLKLLPIVAVFATVKLAGCDSRPSFVVVLLVFFPLEYGLPLQLSPILWLL